MAKHARHIVQEMQRPIVAMDVGGTHARFAIARYGVTGIALSDPVTLQAREFPDLHSAWRRYGEIQGQPLPARAAIAVAAPVDGGRIRFTNNPWTICPDSIAKDLGLEVAYFLNDFEAAAYAVTRCGEDHFLAVGGPKRSLDPSGVTSVIGPGTGLGVASIVREGSQRIVRATEGGHIAFAPLDDFEDTLLKRLRTRHQRVSVERVVSGPAIVDLYNALADWEGRPRATVDDRTIWRQALVDGEMHSLATVERFCRVLGSVAGDIALAHGADQVVIGGGLGLRLAKYLPVSGFSDRFEAKGRFAPRMAQIPVRLFVHPRPGLFGAAAAAASAGI